MVRDIERFPLTYDWQRRLLEDLSERVDLRERALLPSQRHQAHVLLARLSQGAPRAAEPDED